MSATFSGLTANYDKLTKYLQKLGKPLFTAGTALVFLSFLLPAGCGTSFGSSASFVVVFLLPTVFCGARADAAVATLLLAAAAPWAAALLTKADSLRCRLLLSKNTMLTE